VTTKPFSANPRFVKQNGVQPREGAVLTAEDELEAGAWSEVGGDVEANIFGSGRLVGGSLDLIERALLRIFFQVVDVLDACFENLTRGPVVIPDSLRRRLVRDPTRRRGASSVAGWRKHEGFHAAATLGVTGRVQPGGPRFRGRAGRFSSESQSEGQGHPAEAAHFCRPGQKQLVLRVASGRPRII